MTRRLTCFAVVVIIGLIGNYLLGLAIYKALQLILWAT